ncbi:hypothetical protein GCM10025866_02720 [Naasia aerilata]|uniref:Uncharacterized protein n=1 Tax=Naasia aerilata TaxID=1162966 RepID=A0ABM8G852_9MICO|nr:hypothetical protein GCM10025866_02720 [Naasia aerilata]
MTAPMGWALLLGAVLGVGLWALLGVVPRISAPRLADRIAPSLTDVSAEARRIVARRPVDPLPLLGLLGAPLLLWARATLDRALGGRDTIAWRLRAAGDPRTVERHRSEQLLAMAAGAVVGGVAATLTRTGGPLVQLALPLTAAALALVGRDWLLARRARRRLERMREELPTVLEFLMLALAAGEGLPDAVRRIARIGSGSSRANSPG